MQLAQLLKDLVQKQASDLHLKVKSSPIIRVGKELVKLPYPPLTASLIEGFIRELVPESKQKSLSNKQEMDFAYTAPDIGRFRVDIFYQRGDPGLVIRRVETTFSSFSELGLPQTLEKICALNQGIVLICGSARSGKSTTIAAMINYINNHRKMHIITIEDPIEFLFEDKMSIIDQREVGIDTESFSTALKYVMREDPDLIFLGELRDINSFQAMLKAAETGHIVFTTLHAGDAMHAVERIVDYCPMDQKDQTRMQLANYLSAVVSIKLLPGKDGAGMVPAVEMMISTGIVKKLMRENRLTKLITAIESGEEDGMQSFNKSLMKLVQDGRVSKEEALAWAPNPEVLKLNLQGIYFDNGKKIIDS